MPFNSAAATELRPRGEALKTPQLLAILAGLIALSLVVYARVVHYDFVNYDDPVYVKENAHVISGLTLANIRWAFTTFAASNWHPLTFVSFMVDSQLFGMKSGAFHAVNVGLHLVNVLLVFGVMCRLTASPWKSAFVAALFAVHPQHVESVAWITERKDVLSQFFGLLALATYIRYVQRRSWFSYVASVLLLACSLMSKPTFVTFPFLLLLLDWWPLSRTQFTDSLQHSTRTWPLLLLEKVPYLAVSIVMCVVVMFAQETTEARLIQLSLPARLSNAVVAYVLYLAHSVWPAGLAVFYPHRGMGIPVWQVVGAAIVLSSITILVVRERKRRPYLLVGWFWFLGTMVPMVGLVQVGLQQMADRYTYLPCIGLYVALVWLFADLAQNRRVVRPLCASAAVVLLLLAAVAWRQVGYWTNSETLFRRALAVTTNNAIAHVNLAHALQVDAQSDRDGSKLLESIRHYRDSIRLLPSNATAHRNLAFALSLKPGLVQQPVEREDLEAAVEHYHEALRLEPKARNNDNVHYSCGNVLAELGRFDDAAAEYRESLKLNPTFPPAYLNLGIVLSNLDRFPEAIAAVQQSLAVQPNWEPAVNRLSQIHAQFGSALIAQNKSAEAVEQFRQSVALAPTSAIAQFLLGKALSQSQKSDEALQHLQQALKLNADFPEAHCEAGKLLAVRGDRDGAVRHLKEAIRLQPNYEEAIEALKRVSAAP